MSPFELLGLAPDADERAIRRAYAQRLRATRPEDDPQGFQRLHAAYQAALQHCRAPAADEAATTSDPAADHRAARMPPQPELLPDMPAVASEAPALPRLDPAAFCTAAFELAAAGDAAALQAWLAERHELWSLQLKARTGHELMERLYRQVPPMPADCMETLLRFFDLDHALAGHDPLALLQLERRTRLAWQLEVTDRDVLASRLAVRSSSQRWRVHWIVRLLKRPFRWPRVLFVGMNSANAGLIADFVDDVSDKHPEDLPATVDRRQLAFWLAAGERHRVSRPRLILGGARSAAMLLLGVLLAPPLSRWFTGSVSARSMLIVIGLLMIPSALWALWMAWSLLIGWYLRPPRMAMRGSVHTYVVPALCAGGVILGACAQEGLGLALIAPGFWLAVRRYWYHHAGAHALFRSGYFRLMSLLAIPMLHGALNAQLGGELVSYGEVFAALAMLAWVADLRQQRRQAAGAE